MSKVEIDANLGQGLYRVRLKYAMGQVNAEIESIGTRIAVLAVKIPSQKALVLQKEAEVNGIVRDINLLIPGYQSGAEGAADEIRDAQIKLARVQNEYTLLRYDLEMLITENLSISRRRNQLEQIPEERVMDAWCADHTLDLEGFAGAVDVNDEGRQGVIIQPGYANEAGWNAGRDGELMAREAQSGAQAFFNAAILPGVQKWRPRYRVGEISNIVSDYCTVTLDVATSSAQGLPINQTDTLTDVPILYMDCNGDAFEDLDRVLVAYTSIGPLVVGFEKEPKPCSTFGIIFEPAKIRDTNAYPPAWTGIYAFGEPFESEDGLINAPLGTPADITQRRRTAWLASSVEGDLQFSPRKLKSYGTVNWIGPNNLVLSWEGPPGRVFTKLKLSSSDLNYSYAWTTGSVVYQGLKTVLDLSLLPESGAYNVVFGAAINKDAEGQKWLVVITTRVNGLLPVSDFRGFRIAISDALDISGDLQPLGDFAPSSNHQAQTHFYFSEDGSRAVCTTVGDFADELNLSIDLVRFSLSAGFSVEKIWSREDPIGRRLVSAGRERVETDDGNYYTITDRYSEEINTSSHQIPIYCDFIGNREVMTYESHPSWTHAFFMTWIADSQARTTSFDGSYRSLYGDKFKIVTSEGQTIFQEDKVRSGNGSQSALLDNLNPQEVEISLNNSLTHSEIRTRENLLAIDARFGFCAIVVAHKEISRSLTAVGVPANEEITQSSDIELQIWQGGSKLKSNTFYYLSPAVPVTEVIPGSYLNGSQMNQDAGYRFIRDPFLADVSVYPNGPMPCGAPGVLNVGFCKSGRSVIGSVALRSFTGKPEPEIVILNHVSGYSDAIAEIFDRNESDNYYISTIGIV